MGMSAALDSETALLLRRSDERIKDCCQRKQKRQ